MKSTALEDTEVGPPPEHGRGSAPDPREGDGSDDHRITVLFVDSGSGQGGSTRGLAQLLRNLDRGRFRPVVAFNAFNEGPDTRAIRSLDVPVVFASDDPEPDAYVPLPFFFSSSRWAPVRRAEIYARFVLRLAITEIPRALALARTIRERDVDVVYLNNDIHYNIPGVLAAKLGGCSLLLRKAGGIGESRALRRLLLPLVDATFAISSATARDQVETYPRSEGLTVAPPGVDTEAFRPGPPDPALRTDLGIPEGRAVVGWLSRIQEGKGQLQFVRAAARVLERRDDVVFLLVGEEVGGAGRATRALDREVERLGVGDRMIRTGWRRDVPDLLRLMDLFVHVPDEVREGLGIATVEAMAAGRPVIVSRNGGLVDCVVHDRTGLIVPPGDTRALTRAMLELLNDPERARRLGEAARRRAEQRFDAVENTLLIQELIADVAGD